MYFTLLIRKLLKLTNLSTETIATLRRELFKLSLIFVSLILWEILICMNEKLAYSGWVITGMSFITASIASWMILEAK